MILTQDQISFEPKEGWIEHEGAWYHPGLRKLMESGLVAGFEDFASTDQLESPEEKDGQDV